MFITTPCKYTEKPHIQFQVITFEFPALLKECVKYRVTIELHSSSQEGHPNTTLNPGRQGMSLNDTSKSKLFI